MKTTETWNQEAESHTLACIGGSLGCGEWIEWLGLLGLLIIAIGTATVTVASLLGFLLILVV